MSKQNFWFVTLCALLIVSFHVGLILPLRIAIAANAVVIILDIIQQIRGRINAGKTEN